MTDNTEVTTETVTEPTEDQLAALLMLNGDIMQQLLQHPRFQTFLLLNYDISSYRDDENKRVGFTVREHSPAAVLENMRKAQEIDAKDTTPAILAPTQAEMSKLRL